MSGYMKGFSKRKPYEMSSLDKGGMISFYSAPVRHLLESLERESALEKPYLDSGPPKRKHQAPPGSMQRWKSQSSYHITDMWKVEYNRPECVLDIKNLDCAEEPSASISIDYRSGWQTGQEILFWASCDRIDLIEFGDANKVWTATLGGDTVVESGGTLSSTYWSFATLEGRWLREFDNPLKMTCIGGVVYKGGWAATETKFGTSVISQSVSAVSTSGSPTGTVYSGGNVVGSWARGGNVQTLREWGLDPATQSLDGHNAVTQAAQSYARFAGGVAATSFNNVLSGRPPGELTFYERLERRDWFGTPGRIDSWYSGVLQCPSVEVDVSCGGEKCEDAQVSSFNWLVWDSGNSAQAVTAGGAGVTVAVAKGTPPFYWLVSPGEFTLTSPTTTARTNTLTAGAGACGVASITVIEACGRSTHGAVRETGGVNTNWTLEDECGVDWDVPLQFYGIGANGWLLIDNWCGNSVECDSCTDTCPQLVQSYTYPYCRVEANRQYSWTCN